jgi:outer membrane lipoprotein-sorting protein
MTSGVKSLRSCLLIGLLLLGVVRPVLALEMADLMGLLSQHRSGEARFVEQRFVEGLTQPLKSSGTLSFAAPDRFTRNTLEPRAETMAVEGNTVTLQRSGRSRSLTLDASPELQAIVEAVRGTLTGNAQVLQRHFQPALTGDAAQWMLQLTPKDARLAGQVSHVRIGGRRGDVLSVEVLLADDDRSVMAIEPLPRTGSKP